MVAPLLVACFLPFALCAHGRLIEYIFLGSSNGMIWYNPILNISESVSSYWSIQGNSLVSLSAKTMLYSLETHGTSSMLQMLNTSDPFPSWRLLPPPRWYPFEPFDRLYFSAYSMLAIDEKMEYIYGTMANTSAQTFSRSLVGYNISSNNLTYLAESVFDHSGGALTVLGGSLFVVGGYDNTRRVVMNSTERYDPSTRTWTVAAEMNVPRVDGIILLALRGSLFVFGGYDTHTSGDTISFEVEQYDPARNQWLVVAQLPDLVQRNCPYGLAAASLSDGLAYLFCAGSVYAFNPQAPEVWSSPIPYASSSVSVREAIACFGPSIRPTPTPNPIASDSAIPKWVVPVSAGAGGMVLLLVSVLIVRWYKARLARKGYAAIFEGDMSMAYSPIKGGDLF